MLLLRVAKAAACCNAIAAIMLQRYRHNHAVWNGHGTALPLGVAHDAAIDRGSLFVKGVSSAGESLPQAGEGLLQTGWPFRRADLFNAATDLPDHHGREGKFVAVRFNPSNTLGGIGTAIESAGSRGRPGARQGHGFARDAMAPNTSS